MSTCPDGFQGHNQRWKFVSQTEHSLQRHKETSCVCMKLVDKFKPVSRFCATYTTMDDPDRPYRINTPAIPQITSPMGEE